MRYGLTKNLETFRPTTVAFHEWLAIWRDARAATSWRDRLGYVFRGPGWKPHVVPPPARQIADATDRRGMMSG